MPFSKSKPLLLIPVYAAIIFLILYCVATRYYPGGSQADSHSTGFSWMHNYWCNLLNKTAINGHSNSARPIAIAAVVVLCMGLSSFWFVTPAVMNAKARIKWIIQISGILSMIVSFFLLARDVSHDLIINLASSLGLVSTIGLFILLYRKRWRGLLAFGALNFVLVGLNNYLYHSKGMIVYLPLVQKITFAVFLIWTCCVSVSAYRESSKAASSP